MKPTAIKVKKDLVIVGAGMPGIVQAIQAARLGLTCALICNRSFVGGNASAEIAVGICGASNGYEFNYHSRETGIIEELLLENTRRNPDGNRYIWDTVLMDAIFQEENIELFLNTDAYDAEVVDGKITCVYARQNTTEKQFAFEAPLFADNSGDGTLAFVASAEFRYGREGKQEFNENLAPDELDQGVLPSTLIFNARDVGHPVKYTPPKYAIDLTKTDVLKYRTMRYFQYYNHKPSALPEVISLDEFKGNSGGQKYNSIVADPSGKKVLDILPDRFESNLVKYFSQF